MLHLKLSEVGSTVAQQGVYWLIALIVEINWANRP